MSLRCRVSDALFGRYRQLRHTQRGHSAVCGQARRELLCQRLCLHPRKVADDRHTGPLRRVMLAVEGRQVGVLQGIHRLRRGLPAIRVLRVHRRPECLAGNRLGARQRFLQGHHGTCLLTLEDLGFKSGSSQYRT